MTWNEFSNITIAELDSMIYEIEKEGFALEERCKEEYDDAGCDYISDDLWKRRDLIKAEIIRRLTEEKDKISAQLKKLELEINELDPNDVDASATLHDHHSHLMNDNPNPHNGRARRKAIRRKIMSNLTKKIIE